jgi:hypothetical protein
MKIRIFILSLLMVHVSSPDIHFNTGYQGQYGGFSHGSEISGKTVAMVVAAILAAKVAYDMSWHKEYESQAHHWYYLLHDTIARNSISSVQDASLLKLFAQPDFDSIMQYHAWMENSYNSWFCPWNWTASQKIAFNNLLAVEILTMYADLIALGDQVTGQDVLQSLRAKYACVSIYPLVLSYERMEQHSKFIQLNAANLCNAVISTLLQQMATYLDRFKVLLRQEKDYLAELQMKRTHDLQKELIGAVRASRRW